MKKYIVRSLILCVGMIVLTACPSEFDNDLEKNIHVNKTELFGTWKSEYNTIKIGMTLIKGNYFLEFKRNKPDAGTHKFLMYITKINNKNYAVVIPKIDSYTDKYLIVEFEQNGDLLTTKMIRSDETTKAYSSSELYNYLKNNANNLEYNDGFSANYKRVK